MGELFHNFSVKIIEVVGSAYALIVATLLVIVWAVSGPFFNYNDTWLLLINTITTIITFLMVFIIQNSSNRESKAIQLKLDELILTIEKANNNVAGVESAPDEVLLQVEEEIVKEKKDVV